METFKIISLIVFNNLLILTFIYFSKSGSLKICICTIGKLENLYVREYISHYKNYGLDKIFIYDNNDINSERFETVINDYLKIGFVEVINYRGRDKQQIIAYQDCINKNYDKYDWLIFYDMDEFIYLKNFTSIKNYLDQQIFKKCQSIQLNMFFRNDNNLLLYDNRSLFQRFPKQVKRPKEALKSIIKGNKKIKVNCVHNINKNLRSCNGFGEFNKKEKENILTKNPDFQFYYIDHFCFKSTEEFVNKVNRGCAFWGKIDDMKMERIGWYFDKNEITKEKIRYIEKYTNLNLSIFVNNISSKILS